MQNTRSRLRSRRFSSAVFCVAKMRKSITPEALRVYQQILSLKTLTHVFSSVASAIFETFTARVLQRVFFLSFSKTLVLAYVRADFLRQHFVQFNMRNIITPEALLVYSQTLSLKTLSKRIFVSHFGNFQFLFQSNSASLFLVFLQRVRFACVCVDFLR